MGRKKLNTKSQKKNRENEDPPLPFNWIFRSRAWQKSDNSAKYEERKLINNIEDLQMGSNDLEEQKPNVIDIMNDTRNLSLTEIIEILIKEIGISQRG